MRKMDLRGHRYGRLLVLGESPKRGMWVCTCDCGKIKEARTSNLRSGAVSSCGCLRNDRLRSAVKKHGQSGGKDRSKEYRAWAHINGRCHNPKDASYASYGGRGIFVSDEWRFSFDTFLSDMGRSPSPNHSIDRINNDGPYSKENCRWATPSEQRLNTRRTVKIDGIPLPIYCAERGLSYENVLARLNRGHPVELAVSPITGSAYRRLRKECGSCHGD